MDQPLAYFITFTTYGSWLHGRDPGSVDDEHNAFGSPFLSGDQQRETATRQKLSQPPYVLDQARRIVVRDSIVAECVFRGWSLLALQARTNHVHMVIVADCEPEKVMRNVKSNASRGLNAAGFESTDRKRWTTHGSTRYLWRPEQVERAIAYTLNEQGDPMSVYVHPSRQNQSPSSREG
jgi:REP element-mobilizing transposase RayT